MSSSKDFPRRKAVRAFTLIELLIVVAIIAILAAIAVPNFLEAQVRSKVSRVKADMRSIATGLEAYCVDYNMYPFDQDNEPDKEYENGLQMLTTPIAYMSVHPEDPFQVGRRYDEDGDLDNAPWYVLGSGTDNTACSYDDKFDPDSGVEKTLINDSWNGALNDQPVPDARAWVLISRGPDDHDTTIGSDFFPFLCWDEDELEGCVLGFYDPTNGTTSKGDIYRFGGSYMEGNWAIGWYDALDDDVTALDKNLVKDHIEWGSVPVVIP